MKGCQRLGKKTERERYIKPDTKKAERKESGKGKDAKKAERKYSVMTITGKRCMLCMVSKDIRG